MTMVSTMDNVAVMTTGREEHRSRLDDVDSPRRHRDLSRRGRSLSRFSVDTTRAKSNQPVVSLCLQQLTIQEVSELSDRRQCDVYWHNIVYPDMREAVRGGIGTRVNKFPGMSQLTRKIRLSRAIASIQKLFPQEYDFYPRCWFLPTQHLEFAQFCEQRNSSDNQKQWFIVKPDDGAQGTGIYLINGPSDLRDHSMENVLVQEYITDPLLLKDKLKFDLRVYGLIRSLNPLTIYIAREGMVRFCTQPYTTPNRDNRDNVFAHLTNYSLNRTNDAYVHSSNLQDEHQGSKRLLSTVFQQMSANEIDARKVWRHIKQIVVKTILAMVPELMVQFDHHFGDRPGPDCFQIVGFDILITQSLRAVLLEVNANPSLSIEHSIDGSTKVGSIVDEMIKLPLVRDTLLLVLGQLDDEARLRPRTSSEDSVSSFHSKRKHHLQEIFPGRFGTLSRHLLVLDQAVYLFMQVVNLKSSTLLSIAGLRKCNLEAFVSMVELREQFELVSASYVGEFAQQGLPFHGFLEMIFFLATRHQPDRPLIDSVQSFFAYCTGALRHFGVGSSRMRRAQISASRGSDVEFYLLPARARLDKSRLLKGRRKAKKNTQQVQIMTLPKL